MIRKVSYNVSTKKTNKRIVLLTDLHYYQARNMKKLNKVFDELKQEKMDYICLVGDIIDVGEIKDSALLIDWLKALTTLSTVIISLGGHDYYRNRKDHSYYYNHELFDEIRKIKGIHLLDNEIYEDGNIRFIGLTLPLDYYYRYGENVNYFRRFINNTFDSFKKDKYNILLSHTPIPFTKLDNYDDIKVMKSISLVLSGHTHAGITPSFLRDKMHGIGLFSPHCNRMFVKDAYGLIEKGDTKIIISSGITKAAPSNLFSFLEPLFDNEITLIELKK